MLMLYKDQHMTDKVMCAYFSNLNSHKILIPPMF